jgi:hypothetical protein
MTKIIVATITDTIVACNQLNTFRDVMGAVKQVAIRVENQVDDH